MRPGVSPFVQLFGGHPTARVAATARLPDGQADGDPLVAFAGSGLGWDELEVPGCAGDRAIIRGHVIARNRLLPGPTFTPLSIAELAATATASSSILAKLAVGRCGGPPGLTIIDADRALVVPPGRYRVAVLAPDTMVVPTASTPELEGPVVDLAVYVEFCPCGPCPPPPAHLTWYATLESDTELEGRAFTRPRGGRRLLLSSVASGGVSVQLYDGDPTPGGGGTLVGVESIPAGASHVIDPFGAVTHVVLPAAPADVTDVVTLRWEVQP